MPELSERVAIVTGGSTLLMSKVVEALAEAGAKVCVADVDAERGSALADSLGDSVVFKETDVTSDDQLEDLIETTVDAFGGVDILVNGAATYEDEGLETTRDKWLHALDVNLVSGVILTHKVAPHMTERGGGAVINFASISGKRAQPLFFVYSTSKAAILGVTRNEAMKLAEHHIRVNSVSPGWIWSVARISSRFAYTSRLSSSQRPAKRSTSASSASPISCRA